MRRNVFDEEDQLLEPGRFGSYARLGVAEGIARGGFQHRFRIGLTLGIMGRSSSSERR
ncbi:hypothetical protein [Sphingomonas sp.]|uniref:hypothetical protein n=1 Tax=Sphingomonas sp. TaxID=28214 RepID=UPI002ED83590